MKTSNKFLLGAILLFMLTFTIFLVWGKSHLTPGEVRQGSGEIIIDKRGVSPFDKVSCSKNFDVEIVQSSEYYVQVETYENIQDIIVADIEDNELTVKLQYKTGLKIDQDVKIEIGCPEIRKIDANDAVEIDFEDGVISDSLTLEVSGAAEVRGDFNNEFVYIDVNGAGNLDLTGSTQDAIIECSGSGDIDADNFTSNEVNAIVSGAGSVNMNVTERLIANASGAASFNYTGNPKSNVKNSGAASINKLD